MFRQTLAIAALISAMPALLPAQVPESRKEAQQREIEEQIRSMRELLREGKLLRSHVRVTVRLKNGNKIEGVVKDGRLIEKVDGLHFVLAEAKAEGAGVRVWYYDDTVSYIFLPFEGIHHYKVHERLTSNQIEAIERRIAEEERRRAELRRLEQQRLPETGPPGGQTGGEPGATPPGETPPGTGEGKTLTEEEQQMMKLLEEFPPEEGWSEERRAELERRKVTVGVYPAGRDKRFLEIFEQWQRAYERFGKERQTPSGTGQTPPGGR